MKENKYNFTSEQLIAYETLMEGRNVFLTGKAGTGKTYVLDKFIHTMIDNETNIVCCAPTGIAALNLKNGTTMHRAFHLPVKLLLNETVEVSPVIEAADIIVIDEISMCRRDIFEHCIKMIQKVESKTNQKKQIVVVGDFFQLAPITTFEEKEIIVSVYPDWDDGYCFLSQYWKELNFKVINLTSVIRQHEKQFVENLNLIRVGDSRAIGFFNKLVEYNEKRYDPNAVYLTGRNAIVEKVNSEKLRQLEGNVYTFEAMITGKVNRSEYPTSEVLHLKEGARIMMVRNDTEKDMYRNGEMGIIKRIGTDDNETQIHVVLDRGQEVLISRYAWVVEKPVVKSKVDIHTGQKINYIDMEEVGRFVQYPIRLAYAVTIHKSQGQTFDHVILDPYCFAIGQLYVALSRCTSIAGLQLSRKIIKPYLITSVEVRKFYDSFSDIMYTRYIN